MRIELTETYSRKLRNLRCSRGRDWTSLVKAAGEDPASFFEGRNLTGTDFSQTDMSGISFKGAILDGAKFRKGDLASIALCEARSAVGVMEVDPVAEVDEDPLDFEKVWDIIKDSIDHEPAFQAISEYTANGGYASRPQHHAVLGKAARQSEALESLDLMEQCQIPINAIACTKAISLSHGFATALNVFGKVERSGERVDGKLLNALASRAQKPADINLVRKMRLERQIQPDIWSLNSELRNANDFQSAKRAVNHYKFEHKVYPDAVSYRILYSLALEPAHKKWLEQNLRPHIEIDDTRTVNTRINNATDFQECLEIIDSMPLHGIKPDSYSFNLALKKAYKFEDAKEILSRMVVEQVKIDDYSLNTALHSCREYDQFVEIMGHFKDHDVLVDDYTIQRLQQHFRRVFFTKGAIARSILLMAQSREQLIKMIHLLHKQEMVDAYLFSTFLSKLAGFVPAKVLIGDTFKVVKDVEFDGPPFKLFGAAIRTYRVNGQIDQALRLALAWPHLEASSKLFRRHRDDALAYFEREFQTPPPEGEPHHASRALAFCYRDNDEISLAKEWAEKALEFPGLHQKVIAGLCEILSLKDADVAAT